MFVLNLTFLPSPNPLKSCLCGNTPISFSPGNSPRELVPRLEVVIRAKLRNSKNRLRTNIWAHVSQAGLLSTCNSVVSVIDRAILSITADLLQTLHPLPQRGLLILNTTMAVPELQLLHVSIYINLVYLVHSPSCFVRVLGGWSCWGAYRGWFLSASLSEAATTDGRASLGFLI